MLKQRDDAFYNSIDTYQLKKWLISEQDAYNSPSHFLNALIKGLQREMSAKEVSDIFGFEILKTTVCSEGHEQQQKKNIPILEI